ncbi:hypothetical protein F862_gp006 [Vibrio phage vB_VpaS_MAR10]|uniref:Uncharacterized protein n=1 Tax=Vibrio phage vB_VpaS_MAR10 TaxID=1229755 RepID=K7RVG8_9CAUD|nr:hypothetical protein F862_gp006 [Vibrio phage vB_VpaS_MAR10]AFV81240.1 hypothetical protein MAR10_008 [Vibrio phage vB_VpaS_MAR10]
MENNYTYIELVKDVFAALKNLAENGIPLTGKSAATDAAMLGERCPELAKAPIEDVVEAMRLVLNIDGTFKSGIEEKLDSLHVVSAVVMDCDFEDILKDHEVAYCVDKHLDVFTVGAYNAKGGACECCRPYYREGVYLLRAICMKTGDDITKTVLDRKLANSQVGDNK